MSRCARCYGDLQDLAVFCPHCAQLHDPDFDQLIDRIIDDQYHIYRRLGRGGLSTVFAAVDLRTSREVVVKVSDPAQLVRREQSYAIEPEEARRYWSEMIERMRREAEVLATIDHPNIVGFYGTGTINEDLRYVVMEYLRGRTLRQEIDAGGRIEIPETIRIAVEISSALSEVHSRGIIHRDINPRNIFIADHQTDEGSEFFQPSVEYIQLNQPPADIQHSSPPPAIKLIDFGIAKFPQPPGAPPFTQHSVMSGTVAYTSPEQCQNRQIDHRADIYSLGIVLYEMLTGQRPFNGRTPTEIALKQIQSEPAPPRAINPEIPAGLEKAILRAMAKNPEARQQSVKELATELQYGSNQIFITLQESSGDQCDETISDEDTITLNEVYDYAYEDQLKLIRRRRRRIAVLAALLLVISTAGVLFGRHLVGSRRASWANPEKAILAPSPSSTAQNNEPGFSITGSDADALELAAKLSLQNTITVNTASPALPASKQYGPVVRSISSLSTTGSRPAAKSTSAAPAPPRANPQSPPAPSPAVIVNRIPQPDSQPEITQDPRKDENRQTPRRKPDETVAQNQEPAQEVERPDLDGNDGYHRRSETRPGRRGNSNRRENDFDDHAEEQIGPQLIQWRGAVNRERVIKIEMPGVPGMIEIPRVYRDRVGVVEPPGENNSWSCAVLRIFGRGSVSILVRWWPVRRKG
jgi:serine/threonine protein kinase